MISAVFAFGSTTSFAATLQLRFLDSDGMPVPEIGVAIPIRTKAAPAGLNCGTSDPAGRVTCTGVPLGSWALQLRFPRGSDLLLPGRDELVPGVSVSVAKDSDVLRLDIPLTRIDRIELSIEVEGPTPDQAATLTVEEPTLGVRRERSAPLDVPTMLELAPGRWQITVAPPQGFITDQVELDGQSIEAPFATVDVGASGRFRSLTWSFAAPAQLEGSLTLRGDARSRCVPTAALIEPGPVSRRSAAHGFRLPSEARAELLEGGGYRLVLGDGRWSLACLGAQRCATTPPAMELELAAGEARTIDWDAACDPPTTEEDGPAFSVSARALDGRSLGYAVAELRRIPEAKRQPSGRSEQQPELQPDAQPRAKSMGPIEVKRLPTAGRTISIFKASLAPGRYRVTAGSERTGEAELVVTVDGPSIDETFTLPLGGRLDARLTRPERYGTVPVELLLDRIAPSGQPLVLDPELRMRRDHRRVRFDATGVLTILGLDAGSYTIDARIVDPAVRSLVVELEHAQEDRRIERGETIEIADGATIPIKVRLIQLAQLTARLACLGRELLPRTIEIATLIDGDPPREGSAPYPLERNPDETGTALLSGSAFDRLSAGPFVPGAQWIALRPLGFDRWTWLPGDEDPARAAQIDLQPGARDVPEDLLVDCAPSAKLTFMPPEETPTPDLMELELSVESRRLPRPDTDDPTGPWRTHPVDRAAQYMRVRELPEGPLELRLTARHPHFLPAELVIEPRQAVLARGADWLIELPIGPLGGAVRTVVPHAVLRLRREGAAREIGSGTNLIPGTYAIEACADEPCESVTKSWNGVVVTAGTTVTLSE